MSIFDRRSRSLPSLVALCALGSLLGCTPDPEGGGGGTVDAFVWEEGSADNEEPWDAESVDDGWETQLIIEGSMDRCESSATDEWEFTGDNDSYNVEVPDGGFIDVELTWEHDSDLDLFIYINGGGQTWEPDESLTRNGDTPEVWVPDDEFESGDDLVFTVVCGRGPGGDYALVVNWES